MHTRAYPRKAQLDTSLFASTSHWNSGIAGPKYDLEQAKTLVNQVKATGWAGSIRVSCHNGLPDWGIAVKTMLELAGFKVTLDDWNAQSSGPALLQFVQPTATYMAGDTVTVQVTVSNTDSGLGNAAEAYQTTTKPMTGRSPATNFYGLLGQ